MQLQIKVPIIFPFSILLKYTNIHSNIRTPIFRTQIYHDPQQELTGIDKLGQITIVTSDQNINKVN